MGRPLLSVLAMGVLLAMAASHPTSAADGAAQAGAKKKKADSTSSSSSSASSHVAVLTDQTFDSTIAGTSDTWIVEFYAPWCAHCQRLLPQFEEAARKVRAQGLAVRFGKVDVDETPSLKDRFAIEGFPTILYFAPPEAPSGTRPGRTDTSARGAKEYNGPRTAEALRDTAARLSRSPVLNLPTATNEAFDLHAWARENGRDNIVFLFVEDDAVTPFPTPAPEDGDSAAAAAADGPSRLRKAFRSVSRRLRDSLTFASVFESEAKRHQGIAAHLPAAPSSQHKKGSSKKAASSSSSSSAAAGGPPPAPYVARIEAGSRTVEYLTPAQLEKIPFKLVRSGGKRASDAASSAGEEGGASSSSARGTAERMSDLLFSWVQHYRWPTIVELGPDNFAQLANNPEGRLMVVAALKGDEATVSTSASFAVLSALRRLADASTSTLPASSRDRFLFGWLDAATFEAFLNQFGVNAADAPRLVVLDAPGKTFWEDPTVDEEDEIDTWLTDIVEGRAPMQRQGILAVPQRVYNALGIWGAVAVAALVAFAVLYVLYKLVLAEACGWNEAKRKEQQGAARSKAGGEGGGARPRQQEAPRRAAPAPAAEEDDEGEEEDGGEEEDEGKEEDGDDDGEEDGDGAGARPSRSRPGSPGAPDATTAGGDGLRARHAGRRE